MNEERGSAQTPSTQGAPSRRPVGQTSAVNAGFDVTKLGGDKNKKSSKPKKVKKPKKEKIKSPDNNGLSQKSKRPLWFWLVLSLLGVAVLGAVVWGMVKLLNPEEDKKIQLPTDIVLVDDNSNNAVEEYFKQLQSISGKDDNGSTVSGDRSVDDARHAASSAIAATDSEKQENAIRVAEMLLLYHDGKYNEIINELSQVHPEWLGASEQRMFYMAVELAYQQLGNAEMANKYQQLELEATLEACKTNNQLCEEGNS